MLEFPKFSFKKCFENIVGKSNQFYVKSLLVIRDLICSKNKPNLKNQYIYIYFSKV